MIPSVRPALAGRMTTDPLVNSSRNQEKGPLANASGPSLGRKRPRRAAGTRYNRVAALQQYDPALHKRQASLTYRWGTLLRHLGARLYRPGQAHAWLSR